MFLNGFLLDEIGFADTFFGIGLFFGFEPDLECAAGVVKGFEFLFGFDDFGAEFVALSLEFFPFLGSFDDIVGLGVFGLSAFGTV